VLTLFSTAKPFRGHSAVIQRNALKSWTLLHPDVEVILFGDEEGAAQVCAELGLRHEPHVQRSPSGSKFLDYLFRRAQETARHELICYSNCDIILLSDFTRALERVASQHARFLMVSRRWDTNVTEPLDFSLPDWERNIRHLAQQSGTQKSPAFVDHFTFRRGLYPSIPPLVLGRNWWDHWLVWKARQNGADVVDVSSVVTAVHQNHDYGYHPAGSHGIITDPETRANWDLAGGRWHLYTIDDATHVLLPERGGRTRKRLWGLCKRYLSRSWGRCTQPLIPYWFALLGLTRPVRRALGLRQSNLHSLAARWKAGRS
jgi:hypothetical protein